MESVQTEKQTKSFRTASLLLMGVAIMVLILPAYALIFITPVFENMFMQLNKELPILTILLLQTSPTTYVLLFALLIFGLIAKELVLRNKIVTLVINVVIVVGVCPFLFFFVWIMSLPIRNAAG